LGLGSRLITWLQTSFYYLCIKSSSGYSTDFWNPNIWNGRLTAKSWNWKNWFIFILSYTWWFSIYYNMTWISCIFKKIPKTFNQLIKKDFWIIKNDKYFHKSIKFPICFFFLFFFFITIFFIRSEWANLKRDFFTFLLRCCICYVLSLHHHYMQMPYLLTIMLSHECVNVNVSTWAW
jgi:hypothetical protein